MAEVKKARIFLRRGTDADRLQTDLCEGELGYSTDGTRVFIGDGSTVGGNSVGSTTIFKSKGFDITTLTAVSSDGRAEVGDFVFTPASAYNVTTINADAPSSVISVSDYFGTVHTLSSIDAGDGSLTWMAVNSAIPFNHIVVPDNGINGDKIHGGNISGNVVFSGTVSASTLTATNVSATNVRVTSLAGSGNRPVIVDSDGDLIVSSGGSGVVQGAVTFNQAGLSGYSFSITSVDLIALSALNSDLSPLSAVGAGGGNSGSENVNSYQLLSNATDPTYGHYTNSGATGIYKIVFNKSFTTASTLVDAQAFLWRPPAISTSKTSISYTPVIDYYWSGNSTLYVVFSVAEISNSDRKAKGWLNNLYPSSGIEDTRTTFAVKVY